VTRLITLPIVATTEGGARRGRKAELPKLWKRLLPTCLPRLAPIE
jgi:hypothetical protein